MRSSYNNKPPPLEGEIPFGRAQVPRGVPGGKPDTELSEALRRGPRNKALHEKGDNTAPTSRPSDPGLPVRHRNAHQEAGGQVLVGGNAQRAQPGHQGVRPSTTQQHTRRGIRAGTPCSSRRRRRRWCPLPINKPGRNIDKVGDVGSKHDGSTRGRRRTTRREAYETAPCESAPTTA